MAGSQPQFAGRKVLCFQRDMDFLLGFGVSVHLPHIFSANSRFTIGYRLVDL